MGAKGCNIADWMDSSCLFARADGSSIDSSLRLSPKGDAGRADVAGLPFSFEDAVRRGVRGMGWNEWIEATQAAETLQNLQGGRWTEDQYGGVMDDAGVCLDARGWDDASVDCSTRRRTVSDPSRPARLARDDDFFPQFAPGGFGAVGGTYSASRRSPDLSGCACEFPPGMTRIGAHRPPGLRAPIPGFPVRKLFVGEFRGAMDAPQDIRVQISRAAMSRREVESPDVLPIREGAETTRD